MYGRVRVPPARAPALAAVRVAATATATATAAGSNSNVLNVGHGHDNPSNGSSHGNNGRDRDQDGQTAQNYIERWIARERGLSSSPAVAAATQILSEVRFVCVTIVCILYM